MNPFSVLYSFCSICLLVTYSLTITASTVSITSTVIINTTIHDIFMPVTTRLRVKLLTGHTYELSQTSSTGSSELLESSNFTTTTTSNIQHSNTSINSNFILNGDPSIPHQTYLHDHSRPSLLEEHLEISKFQNSEFSNDKVTSSCLSCHNSSISNFITMEADCKDSGSSNNTSSLSKDMVGIQDLFTSLLT